MTTGKQRLWIAGVVAILGATLVVGQEFDAHQSLAGPLYTNIVVADVPWSIHVVKVPRNDRRYALHSPHAGTGALGLSTLKDQLAAVNPGLGVPVAGINGGFYLRDKAYAGVPRGLQVVAGEVLSAPSGNVSFWIDVVGDVHSTNVVSQFGITWPDGRVLPFALNGERPRNGAALYTPAVGASTRTAGGLELVLERPAGGRWLPLQAGRSYVARVREIRRGGDSPLGRDTMIVSLDPGMMERFEAVGPGATLQISTGSIPRLLGARSALSGGPLLVRNGKRQKIRASIEDPYEFSSMLERHPRTAFGWNADWFFLVVVDGRQRDVSDGMTLDELAKCLVELGCDEALNLDGGGSSTLWFKGEVRNSPCDGYERTLANSLLVLRKATKDTAKDLISIRPGTIPEGRSGNER
jgi:hypothetical protein